MPFYTQLTIGSSLSLQSVGGTESFVYCVFLYITKHIIATDEPSKKHSLCDSTKIIAISIALPQTYHIESIIAFSRKIEKINNIPNEKTA